MLARKLGSGGNFCEPTGSHEPVVSERGQYASAAG